MVKFTQRQVDICSRTLRQDLPFGQVCSIPFLVQKVRLSPPFHGSSHVHIFTLCLLHKLVIIFCWDRTELFPSKIKIEKGCEWGGMLPCFYKASKIYPNCHEKITLYINFACVQGRSTMRHQAISSLEICQQRECCSAMVTDCVLEQGNCWNLNFSCVPNFIWHIILPYWPKKDLLIFQNSKILIIDTVDTLHFKSEMTLHS